MKILSLFSGIGGFDLAFLNYGHEIVGACEINNYARKIYRNHFPDVPLHHDIRDITPKDIPKYDTIVAGFPCQSFSTLGNANAFKDARGILFFEMLRFLKNSKHFLFENVPFLLEIDKGHTFKTILDSLAKIGYNVRWSCINSEIVSCQSRNRLYIAGSIGEKPRFKVSNFYTAREKVGKVKLFALDNRGPRKKVNGELSQRTTLKNRSTTWTLLTRPTFAVLNNGKFRYFTPTECEKLQTFPNNWTAGIPDTQRYKCIGNAVTVKVIEQILQRSN